MTTFIIRQEQIPVNENLSGGPLGRHINHDSRSLAYRVAAPLAAAESKMWERVTASFNQGDLGSCTGNASAGQLVTQPFVGTIPTSFTGDEPAAVKIYERATQLDGYSGAYPPTDTGSDGLSAAKACLEMGYISGYTHALSVDDMIAGLQKGPGMVGTNWTSNMDNVNPTTGEIKPGGQVRGGHEYEVSGVDIARGLFWFWQSWGDWGLNGRMFMAIENFATLLAADGDATFFTPLNQPAPVPIPTPSLMRHFSSQADIDNIVDWANSPHIYSKATRAAKAWKRSTS